MSQDDAGSAMPSKARPILTSSGPNANLNTYPNLKTPLDEPTTF